MRDLFYLITLYLSYLGRDRGGLVAEALVRGESEPGVRECGRMPKLAVGPNGLSLTQRAANPNIWGKANGGFPPGTIWTTFESFIDCYSIFFFYQATSTSTATYKTN